MEQKKKQLYPVMRQPEYKKNPNNKVVLIRDKLYINDTLYDENYQEQASANGRNSRYDRPNSITENGNNRRDYRQPIRRTDWGNSSNNRDYSQTPTMDRPLSRQRVSFESENRYKNLINMNTTEMSRQLDMFVGKWKPTSPALNETSLLKPYQAESPHFTSLLENDDEGGNLTDSPIIPSQEVSGQNVTSAMLTNMDTGKISEVASSSCINTAGSNYQGQNVMDTGDTSGGTSSRYLNMVSLNLGDSLQRTNDTTGVLPESSTTQDCTSFQCVNTVDEAQVTGQ